VNVPLLLPELDAALPELELLVPPPDVLPPPPPELLPELVPELAPLLLELPLNEDDEDEPPSTPALPPLSPSSASGSLLAQLAASTTIAMSVADTITSAGARLIELRSSSLAAVGATPHAWALRAPDELVRTIFQPGHAHLRAGLSC
jgi:hypothetical protein